MCESILASTDGPDEQPFPPPLVVSPGSIHQNQNLDVWLFCTVWDEVAGRGKNCQLLRSSIESFRPLFRSRSGPQRIQQLPLARWFSATMREQATKLRAAGHDAQLCTA